MSFLCFFFFSSRRRHTRCSRDWSSDVCSSDLQSLYSWRSADLRNILNFEKDYPDAKVVLLEQNYRSTKLILEAASGVISANRQRKEKGLWTENEAGGPVAVSETYTERE